MAERANGSATAEITKQIRLIVTVLLMRGQAVQREQAFHLADDMSKSQYWGNETFTLFARRQLSNWREGSRAGGPKVSGQPPLRRELRPMEVSV